MKKIFILAVVLCAAISMAFAGTATFTAEVVGEQGTLSTGSLVEKTVDGVTLNIDLGVSSVNPTYNVNWIRAYSNAVVTISSESKISKIEFTTTDPNSDTDDKYSAACLTTTTGNYSVSSDKTQGTWTGSANSVAFTATKQVRFLTITVTTDDENEEPETPSALNAATTFTFSVANGSILFNEAQAATVYNAQGQLLYTSNSTSEINNLPQGEILLVRVNNQIVKVILQS